VSPIVAWFVTYGSLAVAGVSIVMLLAAGLGLVMGKIRASPTLLSRFRRLAAWSAAVGVVAAGVFFWAAQWLVLP
jgi:hypothetical protein